MRTANAIAKQGKLDEALAFLRRVADENPEDEVQLTVAEAQILRDAQRHAEAFGALAGARQAAGSPTFSTTSRSPPRSSSASICSRRICAS